MDDVLSFAPETAQGNFCATCEQSFDGSYAICPNDGTIFAEVRKIEQLLFGRYQIMSVLGAGGAGTVYKGKQQPLGRLVAIKMLKTHSEAQVARFRQEAQVSCLLEHPNIVHVFDFGATSDDQPFMVMDFVDGGDLSELIKREGIPNVHDSLHIFGQICDAMQYAHSKGIVHRDLKPSNIMLSGMDARPHVRVVDFGIAKALGPGVENQNLTSTAELFGSPYYMSPEQALGRPLDARSDIYSLGCLMYETMTFTLPLASSTSFNTLRMHVSEKPISVSERCPNRYSHELENIVMKCLAKDPGKRFHSMQDLKHALDTVPEVLNNSRRLHMSMTMKARPFSVPAPPLAKPIPISRASRFRKVGMIKAVVMTGCMLSMVGGVSAFCLNQLSTKESSSNAGLDSAISSLKALATHSPYPHSSHQAGNWLMSDDKDIFISEHTARQNLRAFEVKHLSGPEVAHDLKKVLLGNQSADQLFVTNCALVEDSLSCLKTQRQITHLLINRCTYPDQSLAVLTQMPQLVGLSISHGKINDQSLKYMNKLSRLESLNLSEQSKLTAAVLKNLPASIEELHLKADTGIAKSSFGLLAKYRNLKRLDLSCTKISDASLPELKRLPVLENIDLSQTSITDDGVDTLASMPSLKIIELTNSNISHDGLMKLAHAPHLKELSIYESDALTKKDFDEFRKATRSVKLIPDVPNRSREKF